MLHAILFTFLFTFVASVSSFNTFTHIADLECTNCKNNLNEFHNKRAIELLQSIASRREVRYFIPETPNESKCRNQVNAWRNATHYGEMWALQMIDAWGKTPDGLLHGNIDIPGLYDQCLDSVSDGFSAKYCTVYYASETKTATSTLNLKKSLGTLSGHRKEDFYSLYNSYGTCVPEACSEKELEEHFTEEFQEIGKQLHRVSCSRSLTSLSDFSFGEIFFLCYLAVIGTLMILGSIITCSNKKPRSQSERLVSAFCPLKNTNKIFNLEEKEGSDSIKSIHGLRVISMIFVHIAHEMGMSLHANNTSASYVTRNTSYSLAFIIGTANLAVDTFLFITGLLIAYSTLKAIHNPRKIRPIAFYLIRFIRLTPPIVVVILFTATFGDRMVTGPWSTEFEVVSKACRKYWWKDIFYVGNFFSTSSSSDTLLTCLGQCWYTAIDFQIFLVAPFLLYLILSYPKKGGLIIMSATLLSFAIPTCYIYYYNMLPTTILKMAAHINDEYLKRMYVMPWHRAAPWFIGFATGYVLLRDQITQKLSKTAVTAGWLASILLVIGVYKTMINMNVNPSVINEIGPLALAAFGGTHRGLWAIALAWIVYTSQTGQAGLARFLEWPGFRPLSRLSYSIFLVSVNVQYALTWSHKTKYSVSLFSKILESFSSFILCVILAYFLSLLTESPITNLMKAPRKERKEKSS